MHSRWTILGPVVLVAAALAGCGDPDSLTGDSPMPTTTIGITTTAPPEPIASSTTIAPHSESAPAILSAAIRHLVAEDHTFGDVPPPFTAYLIQERLDPFAGAPTGGRAELRLLTDAERAAIQVALQDFGPVRWISDPDEWRTDDLMPKIAGSVILGVGEPEISGDTALVPMSLWCSGLCGTWLTYRVELIDGSWQVTGTEGPIAIS